MDRQVDEVVDGLEQGALQLPFMEDYIYYFDPSGMQVLGSHMLEACPSIATGKPMIEVHPLGMR